MRNVVKLVMVSASVLAMAGCSRGTGGQADFVHPDVLAKADLSYYWQRPLKLERGESLARLYLLDENLYCVTNANRVITLDAAKGTFKWSKRLGSRQQTVFRPCHADDMILSDTVATISEILDGTDDRLLEPFDAVCFNTISNLMVFDRRTGHVKRKIPLKFACNTGGACDGTLFYAGSTRGSYHAIRLREAVHLWAYRTDGLLSANVRHHAGTVFVASQDGRIYTNKAGDIRKPMWKRKMRGPVTADFHVDKRGAFVPCGDGLIHTFGLEKGRKLWDPFICEGDLLDPIQVCENTIFQYARPGRFYAINLASGKLRWETRRGREVLAVIDGDVYLLDNDGNLHVVDEILGSVRTSLSLVGMDRFAANTKAEAMYMASASGKVFCVRQIGAEHLKPEDLK